MIKAIIFDMDGVIADSEPFHKKAEQQAFLNFGLKLTIKKLREFTGITDKVLFSQFIKEYKLKTTWQKMLAAKHQVFLKMIKELKPIKGVIKVIKDLKQQKYKLAVASSSDRMLVKIILKHLKVNHFFQVIITADDITKSKPDPQIFLKAAKALKIKPAECLVIEDATLGIVAAKKASMKCLGFQSSKSGNQNLSKADFIFHNFTEVNINLINKL